MADKRENSPDKLRDWLNGWEIECVEEWERQREVEDLLHQENEQHIAQKLWSTFQSCASSIARLYKEGSHPDCVSMWVPFQNAASSVTQFHKDGQEAVDRSYETGKSRGHSRRTHELLAWAKKRRRHIRREDLISFLCGGQSPPSRHSYHRGVSSPRHGVPPSRSTTIPEEREPDQPDLQTFRDALALQGLDGAMSNISMGRRSSPQPHQTGSGEPCPPNSHSTSPASDDFHGIILDEMARRCGPGGRKRSAQSDSYDHSPCWKRSRLWHEDDDPNSLC